MIRKKILITGAAGWLGKTLVNSLTTGDNVCSEQYDPQHICVLLRDENEVNDFQSLILQGMQYVCGDLTSKEKRHEFLSNGQGATLYNIASIIHPNILNQNDFNTINNHAVSKLGSEAAEHEVKKFIAVSSNSPNGYTKNNQIVFNEESEYRPYMGYGKSKMQMEKNIKALSLKNSYTNYTIIRAPWFYGPNQPDRQTTFFSMIKNGVFPIMGKGDNYRSMVYIDNLVNGLILASKYFENNGEIFWIADERPYEMINIINTVKSLLENEFDFQVSNKNLHVPNFTADIARYVDFITQSIGLYIQKIHVLSEMNQTISCSISKANRVLGYSPEISLEEGMRRSIRWCINRGINI